MISVVIHGASGRMGQSVARACKDAGDFQVTGAIAPATVEFPDWPKVPAATELKALEADFDGVIDFSTPEGAVAAAHACARLGKPLVTGTTGLNAAQHDALAQAARTIALLHAPNMSVGVNLLLHLVSTAARALGEEADVEILEAHHRHKKDAPSGTAIRLGEQVAAAWGASLEDRAVYDRDTGKVRELGAIGMASLRAADIVGEHQVMFALPGERLELIHRSSDRSIFAQGALRAARWLVGQPPGLYGMADVLNMKEN